MHKIPNKETLSNNNNGYIHIALYTKNKFLSASPRKYKRLSEQTGKLKLEIYNNDTKGTQNIQYNRLFM